MRAPYLFLTGCLGAAAFLAAPADGAAQTFDTTIAVRSGARLELHNMSGSIEIRATRRSEIHVNVEYDRARIEVDASANAVSLRTVPRRGGGEAAYTVEVPAGTPLQIGGLSSDISVRGVCGEAELQTLSGDVVLDCARGNIIARSTSGDVTVSDVRGRLEAGSTGGDVIVRDAQADVAAQSVSGEVTLEQVEGRDVSAETIGGEVLFSGPIADGGRYRFQSHSGDVTVRPTGRGLNATITVSTFSGDFETDYEVTLTQGGRIRPREIEFTIGNGGARLSLASFSGTVYLRRGIPGRED